jgi:hypothetical protein
MVLRQEKCVCHPQSRIPCLPAQDALLLLTIGAASFAGARSGDTDRMECATFARHEFRSVCTFA